MEENYRDFLKKLYLSRKTKNPLYSLAAYSRDAGFKSYHMNDIINGRYGLSPKRAKVVAQNLKLSEEKKELFLSLVELENPKSPIDRHLAEERVRELLLSTEAIFSAEENPQLGDWYYLAAYELSRQSSRTLQVEDLMSRLGLTIEQAESALAEIENLKKPLATNSEDAQSPETSRAMISVQSKNNGPSTTIRRFHKQMILKSIASMEADPVEERCFSSFNVNLTKEEYVNLSNEVKAFIRKKIHQYQDSESSDQRLYALNLQIFPLEKKRKSTNA